MWKISIFLFLKLWNKGKNHNCKLVWLDFLRVCFCVYKISLNFKWNWRINCTRNIRSKLPMELNVKHLSSIISLWSPLTSKYIPSSISIYNDQSPNKISSKSWLVLEEMYLQEVRTDRKDDSYVPPMNKVCRGYKNNYWKNVSDLGL